MYLTCVCFTAVFFFRIIKTHLRCPEREVSLSHLSSSRLSPAKEVIHMVTNIKTIQKIAFEEKDKSSDIEQQPSFGDRKYSNTLPQMRDGNTKPAGRSYNLDKV